MFNLFRSKPAGLVGYYKLSDWWNSAFTSDERAYIENKFRPLGDSEGSLTKGDIAGCSQSVVMFLSALSGWFNNKSDRPIAQRILNKAAALSKEQELDIFDRHFLWQSVCEAWYPDRNTNPQALDFAIAACREQIAIAADAAKAFKRRWKSIPRHHGYGQLIIILKKQKKTDEACALAKQRDKQGWA